MTYDNICILILGLINKPPPSIFMGMGASNARSFALDRSTWCRPVSSPVPTANRKMTRAEVGGGEVNEFSMG